MISGKTYVRSKYAHWIKFQHIPGATYVDNYVLGVVCVETKPKGHPDRNNGNIIDFQLIDIRTGKFKIKVQKNCNVYWQIY
jgi:coenzyme F420-reducing hydrogenase beta subunit